MFKIVGIVFIGLNTVNEKAHMIEGKSKYKEYGECVAQTIEMQKIFFIKSKENPELNAGPLAVWCVGE